MEITERSIKGGAAEVKKSFMNKKPCIAEHNQNCGRTFLTVL